jgi:dynein heavy chain
VKKIQRLFYQRSTDDVMKAIEDDQVMLSTYKASRFVKPFAREVDNWERDISRILEITEALLNVQKQWLYLEVSPLFTRDNQLFYIK